MPPQRWTAAVRRIATRAMQMYPRSATRLRLLALYVAWQIGYWGWPLRISRRLKAARSMCAHDGYIEFRG
jgi:hypothetical protein